MGKVSSHVEHCAELDKYGIVFVGSFNPAIFHPLWLEKVELVSKSAAEAAVPRIELDLKDETRSPESAKIHVLNSELAYFTIDNMTLQVTHHKLSLESNEPSAGIKIRDLAHGILAILHHSPVRKVGINYNYKLKCKSRDTDARGLSEAIIGNPPPSMSQAIHTRSDFSIPSECDLMEYQLNVKCNWLSDPNIDLEVNYNHHFSLDEQDWYDASGIGSAEAAIRLIEVPSWRQFRQQSLDLLNGILKTEMPDVQ